MTRAWNKLILNGPYLFVHFVVHQPPPPPPDVVVSALLLLPPKKTSSGMLVLLFSYTFLSRSSIFNKRPCAGSKKGAWALMELTKLQCVLPDLKSQDRSVAY